MVKEKDMKSQKTSEEKKTKMTRGLGMYGHEQSEKQWKKVDTGARAAAVCSTIKKHLNNEHFWRSINWTK